MAEELSYMSIFDIIGPVMIGPSSSHTAGAARIGKMIRTIFAELPEQVDIHLYESFAKTFRGHGTDVALVAGLLGMEADDPNLINSPHIAYEQGMEISYVPHFDEAANHPNTAKLVCKKADKKMTVKGISLGGGLVQITEINGFELKISMSVATFVIIERIGQSALTKITEILEKNQIKLLQMTRTHEVKGKETILLLEVEEVENAEQAVQEILALSEISHANFLK
ncbi:MAG: L-serine ammonia-lyase, iron-sulfur-dependent subunit beta [Lactovum sp.]